MKANRSQIFLNAWNLVRKFSITLREALVIAWKEFKLEVVAEKINALELKFMTTEERQEVKLLTVIARELNIALNAIKPVLNIEFNNSGARHDYGIGAYNGD